LAGNRDVSSREISFPGHKAQIPGVVRVSIWTVVIRLAKQWQGVHPRSVACRQWICTPRHQRQRRRDGRRMAAVTTAAMAALARSKVAGSPPGHSRVAEEASWRWSRGEGASTAVMHLSAIRLQLQLLLGHLHSHVMCDPWPHPTQNPKLHLDWFSRFSTAHDRVPVFYNMR